MWKWYQIQISMSINKASMEQSHNDFSVLPVYGSIPIHTEDSWPIVRPGKYLLSDPLGEKNCQPWV